MALIRSIIHMLWMAITVVPYTLAIVLGSLFGMRGTSLYRIARAWLSLCVHSARPLLGIQYRVTGMEHLPQGEKSGAVLLCKHQSTYETFLMPAIMPHPLAYVFKKELLYVPFFGWSIGRLDMIHIDRSLRAKAFQVVQQGKALLAKGTWVIMFPEGTRVERGKGPVQERRHRLAIDTGVPVIPIAVTSARCGPQGLHQKAGRGGCVHRPRHCLRWPPARRADARGGSVDRGRNAPPRPRSLSRRAPAPGRALHRAAAPTDLASRNPAMRQHPHNATRWCRR